MASSGATPRYPVWIAAAMLTVVGLGFLGLSYENDFIIQSNAISNAKLTPPPTNHIVHANRTVEKGATTEALVNSVDNAYTADHYDKSTVHVVYSTSCDQPNRQFLSAGLQISASKVGHRGPMTEIISGCSEQDIVRLAAEPTFYYDYHRHYSPSFNLHPKPGITDSYSPYNKPFALRHLLHTAPSLSNPAAVKGNMPVALVDADFIFFQPLRVNTGTDVAAFYHGGKRQGQPILDTVVDGRALAQDWTPFYGGGWFQPENRDKKDAICAGKPCENITSEDGAEYYAGGGPPYILTKNDWLRIIDDYGDFVIAGRTLSTHWMVEMYAYGLAAGNHHIQHTFVAHLAPTLPKVELHSWSFLDDDMANPCDPTLDVVMPRHPPVAVHYCQKYGFLDKEDEGFHFYKYHVPYDILSCDAMLLELPPPTQWTNIDTLGLTGHALAVKRHEVWTECTLAKILNQVFLTAKEKLCPLGFNTHQGLPMSEPHKRDSALPGGKPKVVPSPR